jgi:hypothetical protein
MDRILITGTGRSGTTFLMKLFTFLGFDTGFTRENYTNDIFKNCNSGMEKEFGYSKFYISKSPLFINNMENIIKDTTLNIKYVIIPIRNYKDSAVSRSKITRRNSTTGGTKGGLWNASNEIEQIRYYYKIMAEYIQIMTKYDINTVFLNFERMVKDEQYLFDKLKPILAEKNINFATFSKSYKEAESTSKPVK